MKVETTIYDKSCKILTLEFDMKSNRTVIYSTELQAKCNKIGWNVGTQQIINFMNTTDSSINAIHQYGQIDAATLQTQAKSSTRASEPYFWQSQGRTIWWWVSASWSQPRQQQELDSYLSKGTTRLRTWCMPHYCTSRSWHLPQSTRWLPPRPYAPTIWGSYLLTAWPSRKTSSSSTPTLTKTKPKSLPVELPMTILSTSYSLCSWLSHATISEATSSASKMPTLMVHSPSLMRNWPSLEPESTICWSRRVHGGKSSQDEDKIVTMQAKLTALKGHFQLPFNLKRAAGIKDKDKDNGGDEKLGEIDGRKIWTRKTMPTRNIKRRMNNQWRPHLRTGKLIKRKKKGCHWHWCKHHIGPGVITRREIAMLAKSASPNRIMDTIKLQPRLPWPPFWILIGMPPWPTWSATWPAIDPSDSHGNHGQHSG